MVKRGGNKKAVGGSVEGGIDASTRGNPSPEDLEWVSPGPLITNDSSNGLGERNRVGLLKHQQTDATRIAGHFWIGFQPIFQTRYGLGDARGKSGHRNVTVQEIRVPGKVIASPDYGDHLTTRVGRCVDSRVVDLAFANVERLAHRIDRAIEPVPGDGICRPEGAEIAGVERVEGKRRFVPLKGQRRSCAVKRERKFHVAHGIFDDLQLMQRNLELIPLVLVSHLVRVGKLDVPPSGV